MLFTSVTIPHSAEDDLETTLSLLLDARRWVSSQRSVKELRKVWVMRAVL